MTAFKNWLIEWILNNPWLVRICPTVFQIQLNLGKLYQFAGRAETAYRAYCKAISANPDSALVYRLAGRLAKANQLDRDWRDFLYLMVNSGECKNALPSLFLLEADTSLTDTERLSLLFKTVSKASRNAALIEQLIKEHLKQEKVEEFINGETQQYVKVLSVKQCQRLLDHALLTSGEKAYELLKKVFSQQVTNFNIPDISDIDQELRSRSSGFRLVKKDNEVDGRKINEWIRVQYFTGNITDDDLFRFTKQHEELGSFCLQLAVEKVRFSRDTELLKRCVQYAVNEQGGKTKEFNLPVIGELLQKHNAHLLAIRVYKKIRELNPNSVYPLSQLSSCYRALGNLSKSLDYIKQEMEVVPNLLNKRKLKIIESELRLLQSITDKQDEVLAKGVNNEKQGSQVLHVLNNSFPYSGNGYAVRSKYIVDHQAKLGLNPVVVTRLGFPSLDGSKELNVEEVEGVPYYRLQRDTYSFSRQPVERFLDKYEKLLVKVGRRVQPRLIHAASNFYNGYPALRCAQKLSIPFVYEVRGFWEMSKSSLIKGYEQSEKYKIHHGMEFHVIEQANHIVTISESLKKYMVEKGLNPNKITVIPNAVDTRFFTPQATNEQLINKYRLAGKTVIGFIGSVTLYEGLDTLLHAVRKLNRPDVVVLIVGSGGALENLKALTKQLNMEDQIIFTGRVPFEEVKNFYSVIDIFPFPRVQSDVCELVTPLKPFEAMAMEKAVLVSKLGALKEMVMDGETGLYFNSGDTDDLSDKLEFLICQEDVRRQLAGNGREWVVKNRDWQHISQRYKTVYDRLI